MTGIDTISPSATTWAPPPAGEAQSLYDQITAGCCCAIDQALDGASGIGDVPPGKDAGADAYPSGDKPVRLDSTGGGPGPTSDTSLTPAAGNSAPVDGFPTSPTGVSDAAQQAARDQSVSADGLAPQARRNLERAWQWGLQLTGGVGDWNEWHADGSSVDVSNYAGGGVGSETPEMRAYANEMYELGKAGVTGPDGGLLVTHVVYAGMRAGASTNWEWQPVTQPDDLTQGHWNHVHVETDSWV
jgi:hypothetical protein